MSYLCTVKLLRVASDMHQRCISVAEREYEERAKTKLKCTSDLNL